MSDVAGPGTAAPRCPACGAAVRADAPWCTQCYLDLRPPPPPPPPPPVAPPRLPPATAFPDVLFDPLTGPIDPVAAPTGSEPTWPCTGCGAANPLTADACGACGRGFLSTVRDTEAPLLAVPGLGDLMRYGRGQRIALALGVVAVFAALTALVSVLLS